MTGLPDSELKNSNGKPVKAYRKCNPSRPDIDNRKAFDDIAINMVVSILHKAPYVLCYGKSDGTY